MNLTKVTGKLKVTNCDIFGETFLWFAENSQTLCGGGALWDPISAIGEIKRDRAFS